MCKDTHSHLAHGVCPDALIGEGMHEGTQVILRFITQKKWKNKLDLHQSIKGSVHASRNGGPRAMSLLSSQQEGFSSLLSSTGKHTHT